MPAVCLLKTALIADNQENVEESCDLMYNDTVPKIETSASIGAQRQRRGNTLATGHRIARIRWINQTTGIAEAKSLIQKALSHALQERVGIRIS